jgi:hypothetical protein
MEDEKWQYRFTGFVFILFTLLVSIVGVNYFISNREGWVLFVTILAVMTMGVLFLSVLDGMRSINKFREGYDIDISELPEEEQGVVKKKPYAHHD